MQADSSSIILVTGAAGYIPAHMIKTLLEKGHKVRGTVRSLTNKENYKFLYDLVPEKNHNLELVEAELKNKDSWKTAVAGCDYVFHMACPDPLFEEKLFEVVEAGAEGILEASLAAGVKKIIFTSSAAAVFIGNDDKIVTEEDRSKKELIQEDPYPKAKLRQEELAFDFYEKHKDQIKVCVINPVYTFGPVFTNRMSYNVALISDILTGAFPGILDVKSPMVSIKDTIEAHYRAMFNDISNGKRYLLAEKVYTLEEIITALKREFGKYGYPINDKQVTAEDAFASSSEIAKFQAEHIGMNFRFSCQKIQDELGIKFHPALDSIIELAYSIIKQGIIPDKIAGANS